MADEMTKEKEQLKELEIARENLARQISSSQKALEELDRKIAFLKTDCTDAVK
ncbi:MAG: hypothetical protein KGS72_25260 [Cyanobacteria bacterium REEB67]|nr:hypothetical protein [Cyanobacteria bacterium REEB67]